MDLLTTREYAEILAAALDAGYTFKTVREALASTPEGHTIILRHDVEWVLRRSLRLARVEHQHGVRSSCYFRADTKVFQLQRMLELQGQGFEIGYHYNALDRCHGDMSRATALFESDLRRMRDAGLEIDTVIAHDDPRIRRVGYRWNGDLEERDPDLLDRNGLSDAKKLKTRFPSFTYLTDLGIRWNGVKSRAAFLRALRERRWGAVYVLTHPDYWSGTVVRAAGLQVAARSLRILQLNKIIAQLRAAR